MTQKIKSYLVANVWEVAAREGDTVAVGDTIVILESMKMEIPVTAETAGTLVELRVNDGDLVQEGDVIGVIQD